MVTKPESNITAHFEDASGRRLIHEMHSLDGLIRGRSLSVLVVRSDTQPPFIIKHISCQRNVPQPQMRIPYCHWRGLGPGLTEEALSPTLVFSKSGETVPANFRAQNPLPNVSVLTGRQSLRASLINCDNFYIHMIFLGVLWVTSHPV
jgi:hypothetical protein